MSPKVRLKLVAVYPPPASPPAALGQRGIRWGLEVGRTYVPMGQFVKESLIF